MPPSVWETVPAAVSMFKELVGRGMKTHEIAAAMTAELKVTFTTGMCVGKLKRLRAKQPLQVTKPRPAPQVVRPPVEIIKPAAEPSSGHRWDDVPSNGCWYELGGVDVRPVDMRFCGKPRAPGRPYCQEHVDVTSHPVPPRGKLAKIM